MNNYQSELSVVVLGYRAGLELKTFVFELAKLLEEAKIDYQLVLVGNYWPRANDITPEIVRELAQANSRIKPIIKSKQGMMGWDMRSGLVAADGRYITVIDGDGQMPAQDIIRVYEKIKGENLDFVKTYRAERLDNFWRRLISVVYNLFFKLLFPGLKARDINSKPKIFRREIFGQLNLVSDDWFTDAEIMIQLRRLKVKIGEIPTIFRENEKRPSFVKFSAIFEFTKNLIKARFKEFKHPIIVILLIALLIRLIFFMLVYSHFGSGGYLSNGGLSLNYYFQFALNFLNDFSFHLDEQPAYLPNSFHVPLYPLFIALIYGLTHSFFVVLLVQVFLSVLAIYLLYYLAKIIFSRRIGLWAAALFAIEPYSIFQSFLLYSEIIFICLFLPAIIYFWQFLNKKLWRYLWGAGIFLGLAALTRAVGQFYLVVLVFFLVLAGLWQKFGWTRILKGALVLIAAIVLILSPWLLRNWIHFRTIGVSYLGPYTFYLYNVADYLVQKNDSFGSLVSRDQERSRMRELIKKKINDPTIEKVEENSPNLIKYQNVFYQESWAVIKKEPFDFFKFEAIFIASFLLNDGYREIFYTFGQNNFESSHFLAKIFKPDNLQPFSLGQSDNRWINGILLLSEFFWLAAYLLIGLAAVKLLWRRSIFILPASFFLITILYFALATGSLSSGRYHWPIVPFVLLLLVFGFHYIFKKNHV